MTVKAETEQSCSEGENSEYPCIALWQRIMPPMSEVYLYVRSNAQGVQLFTSHENLIKNLQSLLTQDILDVVPTYHFVI